MGRTIFIGDIHGCYNEFKLLLKKLDLTNEDKVYLTGDLIGKGPKSFKVLKLLNKNKEQFKSVIGNSELNFLRRLNGDINNVNVNIFEKLKKKIEKHSEILEYLKNLPKYIEKENFILVHGGILPDKELNDHELDDITRIREYTGKPWYSFYKGKKKIIYGHKAIEGIRIRKNTIGIDTGCVYGKRLTAYILETGEIFNQNALDIYLNYYKKEDKLTKIKKLKEYSNKKVAILGFGKEGKSTLNFLQKIGLKNITILDKNKEIKKRGDIKYNLGKSYLDDLGKYDLIFKTPGISPHNEKIRPYMDKLTSQAQVFFDNYKGKVIGITGTKGKSTTSTLTYEVLKNIGYKVKLVGNIGTPVLDEINILEKEKYDFVVYELSSYMLEGLNPNLYIGIINNIYNCHYDWHAGKENYEDAKYNILNNAEYKLVNFELVENPFINSKNSVKYFGLDGKYYYKNGLFYISEHQVLEDKNIALEGEHNRKNISAIVGILDIINSKKISHNINILQKTLEDFIGLPHRQQNIGTYKEIIFIDDAIATTPESTIAAIKTFGEKIGTIFLGGQDSGFDFGNLIKYLEQYKINNVVLFPDSGEKIFGDLSSFEYEKSFILKGSYSPKIFKTKSMKSAVDFAFKNTPKGQICILSNASPSYSLWTGFEEKGNEFQTEVKNYK